MKTRTAKTEVAVREHAVTARASRAADRTPPATRPPAKVDFAEPERYTLRATMVTTRPVIDRVFDGRLKDRSDLQKLLDNPPVLAGRATKRMDGRLVPLVIAVARTREGAPAAGVPVRLRQNGHLRDQAITNPRGVALLRFPQPSGHHGNGNGHAERGDVEGLLEVAAPGIDPVEEPVRIPHESQHTVVELVVDRQPGTEVVRLASTSLEDAATARAPDLRDNPLDRLPADFSTALCADLTTLLGPTQDPILGLAQGSSDFRTRRLPLIKRITVPRLGAEVPGKPPRRFLVRMRQEWTFLGYTLGEIASAEGLDPGAVLGETTEVVRRAVDRASRLVDQSLASSTALTRSSLSQVASVDTLVSVATSAEAGAVAGGFGLALGPLVIGGGGGGTWANASARTRTSVDATLEVNAALHVAKTAVNQVVRTATNAIRDVETTGTTALNRVSPLLSRVTNLLRWTLYENYAVCTHVEDVVEVQSVEISSLGDPSTPLFSDEDVVELRRIFEPGLLERSLRPRFDLLAQAVAARRSAALPISAIRITVDHAAVGAGADLTIGLQGQEVRFTLRPGATRTSETIRLPVPVASSALGDATFDLVLRPELGTPREGITPSVAVNKVRFGFEATPGIVREQIVHLGAEMRVDPATTVDSATEALVPPQPAVATQFDPLFLHVNRNRTYYYGLLCRAALLEPSLRDDVPQLAPFDGNHALWRLPIVGFEGNRALVIRDAPATDPEVVALLADPGAATVVQLACPGAYAEALQGLLQLTDAAGMVHPALLQPPAPVLPPLAIVPIPMDGTLPTAPVPVTGAPLPGTGGTGSTGGTGTGGVLPLPTP